MSELRQPPPTRPGVTDRWTEIVCLGAWFGVLAGLLEYARRTYVGFWFISGMLVNVNPETVWLMALANAALFAAIGLLLGLLRRSWPRLFSLRNCVCMFFLLLFFNLLLTSDRIYVIASLVLSLGIATVATRIVFGNPRSIIGRMARPLIWMLGLRQRNQDQATDAEESDLVVDRRYALTASALCIATPAAGVAIWRKQQESKELNGIAAPKRDMPNVLLLVLDTVRSVNLSLYGYDRATTPNIDRIAKTGVCFDRAVSGAPWTLTSHACMFTGRYPTELSCGWSGPLDNEHTTLAEQFAMRGYATAGIAANTLYCDRRYGLGRGFHHYEDFFLRPSLIPQQSSLFRTVSMTAAYREATRSYDTYGRPYADCINDRFQRWLSGVNHRPFFAFLNYFDAHGPYVPPAPFNSKFGPARRRGELPMRFRPRKPRGGFPLTPEQLETEISQYDGAIAYVDHQVGNLVDHLEEVGELDNTILVIVSDHGEEFAEHGVVNHGNSLYFPSLHVPLVLRQPNRIPAGIRVSNAVSLRDLGATLLDLADQHDPSVFPGTSMSRFWSDSSDINQTEPLMSFVAKSARNPEWYPTSRGDIQSVYFEPHHYIHNDDGHEEVYNVTNDLMEAHNMIDTDEGREVARDCRRFLEQHVSQLAKTGGRRH